MMNFSRKQQGFAHCLFYNYHVFQHYTMVCASMVPWTIDQTTVNRHQKVLVPIEDHITEFVLEVPDETPETKMVAVKLSAVRFVIMTAAAKLGEVEKTLACTKGMPEKPELGNEITPATSLPVSMAQ